MRSNLQNQNRRRRMMHDPHWRKLSKLQARKSREQELIERVITVIRFVLVRLSDVTLALGAGLTLFAMTEGQGEPFPIFQIWILIIFTLVFLCYREMEIKMNLLWEIGIFFITLGLILMLVLLILNLWLYYLKRKYQE